MKTQLAHIIMCVFAVFFGSNVRASEKNLHDPLTGQSFEGEVRAKGIYGLVGVKGSLSFERGKLIWTTQDSSESGDYRIVKNDGVWLFSSRYTIANEEGVYWQGRFDGTRLYDVHITWSRQPGDWVHDLLLPGQMTLQFKPLK